MMAPALPFSLVLEECRICTTANRTGNDSTPAVSNHVAEAVIRIRKIDNRFLQCFRLSGFVFHGPRVPESSGFVKYVNAFSITFFRWLEANRAEREASQARAFCARRAS